MCLVSFLGCRSPRWERARGRCIPSAHRGLPRQGAGPCVDAGRCCLLLALLWLFGFCWFRWEGQPHKAAETPRCNI